MIRAFTILMLLMGGSVLAQEDLESHARIRFVEPGVTLQHASDQEGQEAGVNEPFLAGDILTTDGYGRVELQFDDGSSIRLDSDGRLDFLGQNDGADAAVRLRLRQGAVFVHLHSRGIGFAIETPGGVVEIDAGGRYRVDVVGSEARLSVYAGEATFDSGRQPVNVGAGERTYARRGRAPETPRGFDTRAGDDFSRWDESRGGDAGYAAETGRYLPDEVAPYGAELESNGSWYYEAEVGNVWRPHVGHDWRPYCDGRWAWTSYGWTWVPAEAWGWAPSHYGRWGFSGALGWYWIPGAAWSPAWVSWAVGGDYVGWCPLGSHDRPVVVQGAATGRGYAVARGSAADPASSSAWVYARKGDLASRDLAARRVAIKPTDANQVHILDSPRLRPGRDLRVTEARSFHDPASTKPTIGDWVPELRSDPKTTIPPPYLRYHGSDRDRNDSRREQAQRPGDWRSNDRPPDARGESHDAPRGVMPGSPLRSEKTGRRDPPRDGYLRDRPLHRPVEGDADQGRATRERDAEHGRDSDREVIRRFFQPVREREKESPPPREREPESRPRYEPRTPPQHTTPRTSAPPRREPPRTQEPRHTPPPDHGRDREKHP